MASVKTIISYKRGTNPVSMTTIYLWKTLAEHSDLNFMLSKPSTQDCDC